MQTFDGKCKCKPLMANARQMLKKCNPVLQDKPLMRKIDALKFGGKCKYKFYTMKSNANASKNKLVDGKNANINSKQ